MENTNFVNGNVTAQKHYRRYRAVEDCQAKIQEFVNTPEGALFLKALEASKEFYEQKKIEGPYVKELDYFYNISATEGEFNAFYNLYCIALKTGYEMAKKEALRKAE